MSGISPVSGTTFFGYVPAALPFAAPTPPATPTSTSTSTSTSSGTSSDTSTSSGASTSAATSTPATAADQLQLATLGLESSITTALFGAAPADTTATASFFSNAGMYSLLGSSGGAVISYLNSQSGVTSSSAASATSTPAADTTTPAATTSSTVDTTA